MLNQRSKPTQPCGPVRLTWEERVAVRQAREEIEAANAPRLIVGVASTFSVNSHGYRVNPMGLKGALPIPVLFRHQQSPQPIGRVVEVETNPDVVLTLAEIDRDDPTADWVWRRIADGRARGFSLAIDTSKANSWHWAGKNLQEYDEWHARELTVCEQGACPGTWFEVIPRYMSLAECKLRVPLVRAASQGFEELQRHLQEKRDAELETSLGKRLDRALAKMAGAEKPSKTAEQLNAAPPEKPRSESSYDYTENGTGKRKRCITRQYPDRTVAEYIDLPSDDVAKESA